MPRRSGAAPGSAPASDLCTREGGGPPPCGRAFAAAATITIPTPTFKRAISGWPMRNQSSAEAANSKPAMPNPRTRLSLVVIPISTAVAEPPNAAAARWARTDQARQMARVLRHLVGQIATHRGPYQRFFAAMTRAYQLFVSRSSRLPNSDYACRHHTGAVESISCESWPRSQRHPVLCRPADPGRVTTSLPPLAWPNRARDTTRLEAAVRGSWRAASANIGKVMVRRDDRDFGSFTTSSFPTRESDRHTLIAPAEKSRSAYVSACN